MSDAQTSETATVEMLVAEATDDFLDRLSRGECPEVDDYARRYPQIAAVLRQVLPALQLIRSSAAGNANDAAAAGPDFPLAVPMGDFRIVREIGRGGMGIVYEAEQVSLGRRVALKVLPFAAALDSKQLQRFKNEALAAAQLHHTNIVPVINVGCEHGFHYYAMQYIEGQTLAALIAELRQRQRDQETRRPGDKETIEAKETEVPISLSPGLQVSVSGFYRTVAHLGVQAAEALEHAHGVGIVHRDIKPANLLVDVRGNLWVTDFGLAQFRADTHLTMTGDVLGTLRYMSPEQALGQRVQVDHRTDIYSLGATLYELLTLEPVFAGTDRGELLQQIAFADPRPPRRWNPAVPVELETIVTKAMSKQPEERYVTAQALADDLRRFLEDKPIQAKRPTLGQRVRKWARRHRAVVWSSLGATFGLLLMAVAGLVISNAFIKRERDAKVRALEAETQARTEADAQRRRAEANFEKALAAVDAMLTNVAQNRVTRLAQMEPLRRELLQEALRLYQELLRDNAGSGALYEEALIYRNLAGLYGNLAQPAQAEQAFAVAADRAEQLVADNATEPKYRHELATVHYSWAYFIGGARRGETERHLRRAIALWEGLRGELPSCRQNLARAYHNLGYLQWGADRTAEAETAYRQALQQWQELGEEVTQRYGRPGQARVYNSLGLLLRKTNRPAEAEKAHRQALELLEALAADHSGEQARGHFHLALALWQQGKREDAIPHARANAALLKDAAKEFPLDAYFRRELAPGCQVLGRMLEVTGHRQEAEEAYRNALAIAETLVKEAPDMSAAEETLINASFSLGRLLLAAGRPSDAEEIARRIEQLSPRHAVAQNVLAWLLATWPDSKFRNPHRAVDIAKRAVEREPKDGMYWNTLGAAHYRAGDWKATIAALDKSMELRQGGDSFDWFFLAMAYWQLGDKERARKWYDQASAWTEKNKPSDAELKRFRAEAAELLGISTKENSPQRHKGHKEDSKEKQGT